jgi:hypothetical protein
MTALAETNSFRFHVSESKCSSVSLTSYSWQLLSIFSDVQVIDWKPSYDKSCKGNTFWRPPKTLGAWERPGDPVVSPPDKTLSWRFFNSTLCDKNYNKLNLCLCIYLRAYLIFLRYFLRNKSILKTYILEVLQILKPLKSIQFCMYIC